MPGRRVCLATGAVALAPSLGAAGPFVCVCVCVLFFCRYRYRCWVFIYVCFVYVWWNVLRVSWCVYIVMIFWY